VNNSERRRSPGAEKENNPSTTETPLRISIEKKQTSPANRPKQKSRMLSQNFPGTPGK